MKNKLIIILLSVVALTVPFFIIAESSPIQAGVYLAFAIMIAGGAVGVSFKSNKNQTGGE